MKKLIIALIVSMAPAAFAETLECSFTEPFFSLSYDSRTQVLKRTEPDWENDAGKVVTRVVARNVRVVPLSNVKTNELTSFTRFALIGRDGTVHLRLTLNYQGSDGMSDITFPYDAVIPNSRTSANNGVGGCESGTLAAINPDQPQ